jgi:hypothetical protein
MGRGLGGGRPEKGGRMRPGEATFCVFGWVERRNAGQESGFFDKATIGIRSAVPRFFGAAGFLLEARDGSLRTGRALAGC